MSQSIRHGFWRTLLICGFAAACLTAAPGHCADDASSKPAVPAPAGDYDVTIGPIQAIPPGTVIGDGAPQGWSNLILKSQPRISQGDVKKAPGLVVTMARLLSVCTVANVTSTEVDGRARFKIDRVALGFATRIGDRDVVISSDTQAKLGAGLGMIQRTVLSGSEDEMKTIKQVLRSPTMYMFDGPTTVVYQQQHRPMVVRQSILVDAATGRLFTLIWLIDKNSAGDYTTAVSPMNLLAPNTLEDRQLSVDANQFTFGMPSSTAIAMVRLPPGAPIAIPDDLQSLAAAPRFTEESGQKLETALRNLIREEFRKQLAGGDESRDQAIGPGQPMVK